MTLPLLLKAYEKSSEVIRRPSCGLGSGDACGFPHHR
jgi:hypothetical protein